MSIYCTESQSFEERPATFSWASLRSEFTFTPLRMKTALKVAIGATLALFLACAFNWKSAGLAMVMSPLFDRPDTRFDLQQSIAAAIATAALSTFLYWTLNWSQEPLIFGLLVGGVLIVYGGLTTLPVYGFCFAMAQVVGASTLALDFYQPNPPQDVFMPLTAIIGLGFGTMFAVNFFLWPYSPREAFDERLRLAWEECRVQIALWQTRPGGSGQLRRPDPLDLRILELLTSSTTLTSTDPADEGPQLRVNAVRRLQEFMMALQDVRRTGDEVELTSAGSAFQTFAKLLEKQAATFGHILCGKRDCLLETGNDALREAAKILCEAIPEENANGRIFVKSFQQFCHAMDGCGEAFCALAEWACVEGITGRKQRIIWAPRFHWRMLLQLRPASFRQGVRVALVVLGCMLFWQAFRWPNGNTMLISGLTVTLPIVGLSSRQSVLRIWGLLLGLLVAYLCIVLVVPRVESFVGYGACIFCALVFFGYLAGASPRIAYLGFQAALTFLFCFVYDDLQSIDLEPLRARFVALSMGVVIASLITHHLWPVRQVNAVCESLARNFSACAQCWLAIVQKNWDGLIVAQERFNRSLVEAAQLTSAIEYEGGEGRVRFGYASRFLAHEFALFEQLHLLGREQSDRGRRTCHKASASAITSRSSASDWADPTRVFRSHRLANFTPTTPLQEKDYRP